MINRAELKSMAKAQLKGNIGILFVMFLIVIGFEIVAISVPIAGGLVSGFILEPVFTVSLALVFLDLSKGIKPEISRIFDGFYNMWCAVKVALFVGLFTILWSFLFIIPGIIKAHSYSMSLFILAENKGMPALEAIRRSKEMMEGHKMDLFVLCLSFLGWIYLGAFTFGIGYIWIFPYFWATLVNFYNTIKPQDTVVVTDAEIVEEVEITNNEEITE